MARMLTGSIDLTTLGELVRAKHPAAVKSTTNNKTYLNVTVWVNDDVNEYDQIGSISVYDKETKKTVYLGNFKEFVKDQPQPLGDSDTDDLPY